MVLTCRKHRTTDKTCQEPQNQKTGYVLDSGGDRLQNDKDCERDNIWDVPSNRWDLAEGRKEEWTYPVSNDEECQSERGYRMVRTKLHDEGFVSRTVDG